MNLPPQSSLSTRARPPRVRQALGRLGLVRQRVLFRCGPEDGALFHASSIGAHTELYEGTSTPGDTGAIGERGDDAETSALGECLERYAFASLRGTRCRIASADELGDEAVGPDRIPLFAPEQYRAPDFPYAPFRRDVPIRWVEARSMVTGRRRWVPACLVFVPYVPFDAADRICFGVSTGQACHETLERAALTGLWEAVERDAFMVAWHQRRSLPRVYPEHDPELAPFVRRFFGRIWARAYVLDATNDLGVPTYLCFLEADGPRGPLVVMGAATRRSPRAAIAKAMLEGAQALKWLRDLMKRRADWRPTPTYDNLETFEDHVRLYGEPGMREALGFWLDDAPAGSIPTEPAPTDDATALAEAVGKVAARELEPLLVQSRPRDVAALGLVAAKVIVPGTAMLHAYHPMPALACPRLWRGVNGELVTSANPLPHPFP